MEVSGGMSGVLKVVVGLLVGIVLTVGALFGLNKMSLLEEPTRSITSTGIGGTLEDISEMAVEQYSYSAVGRFEEDGWRALGLRVPLTGKHFLIAYDGVVKAGVKNIEKSDVSIDDVTSTVTIKVSKAEILSNEIEPSSVTVYDQSFNPLNQVRVENYAEFLDGEEKRAEEKAKQNGLLDRAQQRVTDLVKAQAEAFLAGSDKDGYEVQVIIA
ncbi:DUF4230 domain-containing protein [Corynebacterium pseudodiphtheriticum]|uniref:DUF4230 domain-containing protein n=3 Tax=Corynebacterium pseudodiphtheriticum TaxID=37637 RepID=UPI00047CFAD6|nr:DUF4230 domain-containing protein [Corynebacterium pseudodiphtheriticum]MCG7251996.1 DUF4230 domain-containing protein [Corynebacterium pseudodiphtheriticum]MCT1635870.1 DUF4230 domain-containing protein [Corynebacterium pseudodiphtheriticum]MCT1666846.1 DUF4230 domain-containing protein [Corynebacterium pseudodiphtheriticum]MDK4278271.1 DUF4230 domain-containing protein [Corynebacterium pseudodiphtheriticum]MDK4284350.1 DUF4230 domain-containing protein [Corynebacterium pseudodiphtheriticu